MFTVGHSNHALERFLGLLRAHSIQRVIDVRRFPASRRWPHFDAARLPASLRAAGIDYVGLPELGGRRRARPDSPHTAWRVEGFRGYADFADTAAFAAGLKKLAALAGERVSAVMCAEALPWRCHRSLIADALLARGWRVRDILSERVAREHELPDFARLEGKSVVYDAGNPPPPKED